MKTTLARLALIGVFVGLAPIPSYFLFVCLDDHTPLFSPGLYGALVIVALISFLSFTVTRTASSMKKQLLNGVVLSCLALVFPYLVCAFFLDETGVALILSPVIELFLNHRAGNVCVDGQADV